MTTLLNKAEVHAQDKEIKAQHTPGPWRLIPIANYRRVVGPGKRPGTEATLAEVFPRHAGQGEANACLIAAAPDLLAACKQIALEMDSAREAAGEWYLDITSDGQQMIRAAIAKATSTE